MGKIIINDLEIFAFHGANKEEKQMGQKFIVSAELSLDLRRAGQSDDLTKTIDYGKLCKELEIEFTRKAYNLIEKSVEKLCEYVLLTHASVEKVKITVKKPWAPIHMPLKYAAVSITRQWHRAYIGVGSNLGNKEENIHQAITFINNSDYTKVIKISDLIETEPVGYLDQDNFINGAFEIKTLLNPRELIRFMLDIEQQLKRKRVTKWGPRTIDLDVLLYDNIITTVEEIIIPHPRMHERKFVLEPLSQIAPYEMHPILNKRIYELNDEISN